MTRWECRIADPGLECVVLGVAVSDIGEWERVDAPTREEAARVYVARLKAAGELRVSRPVHVAVREAAP